MTRGFQLDVGGVTAAEMASLFPALAQVRWHQALGKSGAVQLLFDTGLSLLLHGKTVHEWSRSLARLDVDVEELAWYLGLEDSTPCRDRSLAGLLRELANCLTPSLPSNEPVFVPAQVSVPAPAMAKLAAANYLR